MEFHIAFEQLSQAGLLRRVRMDLSQACPHQCRKFRRHLRLQQLAFPNRVLVWRQKAHEEQPRFRVAPQHVRHIFGEMRAHLLIPGVFVGIAGQGRLPIG